MTTMKLAMMPMTSQKYHLRGKTLTSERRKRRERHRSTAYRSSCGVSPGVRPSQRESEGVGEGTISHALEPNKSESTGIGTLMLTPTAEL